MIKQIYLLTIMCIALGNLSLSASDIDTQTKGIWELYTNNKVMESYDECSKLLEKNPNDINLIMVGIDLSAATFKGDAEGLFGRLLELVDNPNPYVYSYFGLWQFRSNDYRKITSQIDLLNKILKNPKLDETSIGLLNNELAKRYIQIKDIKNGKLAYAKVGAINNWELLGPFSNIVGIGFDKEEIVINHPEHYTFSGQFGSKITWYEYKNSYDGEWVYLDNYNAGNNTIVFAQTFVESDKDRDLLLEIGFSGSLKVFVNDVIAVKEQKELNNGIDAYTTKIKLNKGFNRILVQVGQSDNTASNFLARIKELNGKLASGLKYHATAKEYTKSKNAPAFGECKTQYFKYFEELYKNATLLQDFHSYKYAKLCITLGSYNNSLEISEKLSEKYPKSVAMKSLLAEYYGRKRNTTKQNEIVKEAQTLDSNTYSFFSNEIGQLFAKEDYASCLELLEKYKHLQTEELYYSMLIEIYAKEKKYEKLIEYINIAYEKYPYNKGLIQLKVLLENEKATNLNEVLKYVTKVSDKVLDLDLTKLYCNLLMKNNKYDELFDFIEKEKQYYYGVSLFDMYVSEIYQNKQMYDKAEEHFNKILEYCPNYSGINERIADLYTTKDVAKAKQYYEYSIKSYPYDYDVIRKIRDLEDKPAIFNLFGEEDYYKLFANFKENSSDNNNINYILDEDQVVVYASGASERKHILLGKVLTETGIDDLKEFYVYGYNNEETVIEKAEVIKANGNKIPAEVNNSEIVFPNLKIGDGILVIYRVKHFSLPGMSNQFFYDKIFQNNEWTAKCKLKFLVDKSYKFNHNKTGDKVTLTTNEIENFKLYTWEKSDIAKYNYEEAIPNAYDINDIVNISSLDKWSEINNWYKNISNNNNDDDDLINRKISELFPNGYDSFSELERAKILYNYIVKNVRYSSVAFRNTGLIPQKPSEVLSTSLGDCKDVAMLYKVLGERVKLNINLVLVATKDYGSKQLELPNINFNHCMALLRINNKKYFVELTSDFNGFNVLSPNTIGSLYFEIGNNVDEKLGKLDSETRQLNSITRKSDINFNDDSMTVTKTYIMYGNSASYARINLKNKSKKEQDEFFTDYMPTLYPNKELIDYKFDDLTDLYRDSVTYSFKYKVESPFSNIGNMYVLRPPFSQSKEDLSFVNKKERNFPFCLWQIKLDYDKEEEIINLNFPEGKTISELPKDVVIDNEIFKYQLKYVKGENSCKIIRNSFVKVLTVPVEKYAVLTSSIKKMVEAEKVQLAFVDYVKPSPSKKTKK